jgi:transcriptional regulator with XRE-family HTH domain
MDFVVRAISSELHDLSIAVENLLAMYIRYRYRKNMTADSTLRKWRLSRGFDQTEAAKFLGVAQSTYSDWENGRKSPSLENIVMLEKRTGGAVRAASLLAGRQKRDSGHEGKRIRSSDTRKAEHSVRASAKP